MNEKHINETIFLLLKDLRAEQSQTQLSRELGYSYNIYGRWEKGTRAFLWNDFIKIAENKGFNISECFLRSFKIPLEENYDDSNLLKVYLKSHSNPLYDILSKKKIDRVIRGERKLKFSEFLLLYDSLTYSSLRFLQYFVQPKTFLNMKSLATSEMREKILYDNDTLIVLHILDLDWYKSLKCHSNEYLAKKSHIDIGIIEKKLRQLEFLGIIEMHENGLYSLCDKSEKHLVYPKEKSNIIHNSWRKMIYDQSLQERSLSSSIEKSLRGAHIIFSSNKKLDLEIAEIVTRMFNDINSAVRNFDNDEEVSTHLQVLSINLFNPLVRSFDKSE